MKQLAAYPFRLFFMLTALYAALLIAAWAAVLTGLLLPPADWPILQWHSHEMLYGLTSAAIAGFLLTAICNWTGARPLQGLPLLALGLLWLAGRLAFWLAGWLPNWLVSFIDLAFIPVMAIYLLKTLVRAGNRRNMILVFVLLAFYAGNLLMHSGVIFNQPPLILKGQSLAIDVITVLMIIIAGRITPAFTTNWLRQTGGNASSVKQSALLDKLSVASAILLLLTQAVGASAIFIGTASLLAGMANGLRLVGWAGWRTCKEPLLWILHLGYLWLVIAFFLRAASHLQWAALPASLWVHVLGLGGIATLILGVMTRVALGHTGRPLKLPRFAASIYTAITLATVTRLLTAAEIIDFHTGILLAATLWIAAFLLFLVFYTPILSAPRADGKPG